MESVLEGSVDWRKVFAQNVDNVAPSELGEYDERMDRFRRGGSQMGVGQDVSN